MDHYKTLIFDLGNVLISFSHEKMYAQLARLCEMPTAAIKELFQESRVGMQYERGLVSSAEIHSLLQETSGKDLSYTEVLEAGSDIFTPRPDMVDLIKTLKKQGYHLLLLSNTNEAHYQFIDKQFGLFDLFHHLILSFEIGAVKPERAIFEEVLKHGHCPPHACYYTDDIPEYVQAAEKWGIKGHVFQSPALLLEDLHRNRII